jgi:IstB-like ATP binding protein
VLTSNRAFSDWGQVFADQVVATAIADRLIDNAVVINIRGRSYSMRAHPDAANGKNGLYSNRSRKIEPLRCLWTPGTVSSTLTGPAEISFEEMMLQFAQPPWNRRNP